jgi:FKBP-type peptidyl-prolyl cis-trans isomerase
VEINYRGTLIDGTELESSEAGKSATFKVATVIPGWKEALKLMPVGSKWQLFVPPELVIASAARTVSRQTASSSLKLS